mmetsp:Transcript_2050/g.6149  ORF Transcript_2050/g.6149 Transcript_2050/m.6149 type:complete len:301 (-) Transcript_2050:2-904(-)
MELRNTARPASLRERLGCGRSAVGTRRRSSASGMSRLTVSTSSHSAACIFRRVRSRVRPALSTTASTVSQPQSSSMAASSAEAAPEGSFASAQAYRALACRAQKSRSRSSFAARSLTSSSAPLAASSSQVSAPMPPPAPVTSTRRPATSKSPSRLGAPLPPRPGVTGQTCPVTYAAAGLASQSKGPASATSPAPLRSSSALHVTPPRATSLERLRTKPCSTPSRVAPSTTPSKPPSQPSSSSRATSKMRCTPPLPLSWRPARRRCKDSRKAFAEATPVRSTSTVSAPAPAPPSTQRSLGQ